MSVDDVFTKDSTTVTAGGGSKIESEALSDEDDGGFEMGAAPQVSFEQYSQMDNDIFHEQVIFWQKKRQEINLSARMNTRYVLDICLNAQKTTLKKILKTKHNIKVVRRNTVDNDFASMRDDCYSREIDCLPEPKGPLECLQRKSWSWHYTNPNSQDKQNMVVPLNDLDCLLLEEMVEYK